MLSLYVLLASEEWWSLSLDLEQIEAKVEETVAAMVGGPIWAGSGHHHKGPTLPVPRPWSLGTEDMMGRPPGQVVALWYRIP